MIIVTRSFIFLLCLITFVHRLEAFPMLFGIDDLNNATDLFNCTDIGYNDSSNWMACASLETRQRPILSLAIPGSHDSFAYWLDTDPQLTLAPDMPSWQNNLLTLWSFFWGRLELRQMLRNWSLTQSLDVVEQLSMGVRYFDIRIAYDESSKQLRFVHMLWGKPVFEELAKIADFLNEHPGEVVILDFNHFYEMKSEHHKQLTQFLVATFGSKIVSFRKWSRLNGLTLSQLHEEKLQVVIVYHDGYGVYLSATTFWPSPAASSPWADTDQIGDLLAFLDKQYRNRTGLFYSFFVYQGILTPSAPLVAGHFTTGSLRHDLAEKATPAFVAWLTATSSKRKRRRRYLKPKRNGTTTNKLLAISIADFVEIANFTETVIRLNC